MDTAVSMQSAAQAMPLPVVRPDLRPAADAAAVARDPRPDLPMPIPASLAQTAVVAQSRLSASDGRMTVQGVERAERVLKPYGVKMLPERDTPSPAATAEALEAEARKTAAEDKTATAEAEVAEAEAAVAEATATTAGRQPADA